MRCWGVVQVRSQHLFSTSLELSPQLLLYFGFSGILPWSDFLFSLWIIEKEREVNMRLGKFLVDCGVGVGPAASQANKITSEWKKRQQGSYRLISGIRWPLWNLVHETFVYYLLNKPAESSSDWRWSPPSCAGLLDETARHKEVFPMGAWISIPMACSFDQWQARSSMLRRRSMCRRSTVPRWMGSWMRQCNTKQALPSRFHDFACHWCRS